eukprot:GHRR01014645.1.p1 GENE.GHRR01014645.1~~GHRR01014645.1.p1  ORF type:complete len:142 (+),score=35.45 GHRR01014645.1:1008-1433(+)
MGGQPDRAAVDYVALAPYDRYFLQHHDGSMRWIGPTSLSEGELYNKSHCSAELLAIAPNDGWYILWKNGSSAWEGIPLGLHNQIYGRETSMPKGTPAAIVEYLAIGPNEEWFVRYANGDWRARNLGNSLLDTIDKIQGRWQ